MTPKDEGLETRLNQIIRWAATRAIGSPHMPVEEVIGFASNLAAQVLAASAERERGLRSQLHATAEDALGMAEEIGELTGMEDGPCPPGDLCGNVWCAGCGCIKDKADRARQALSTPKDEGGGEGKDKGRSSQKPDLSEPRQTANDLAEAIAMLDRYEAPLLDESDGGPLSVADRIEAMVYRRRRAGSGRVVTRDPDETETEGSVSYAEAGVSFDELYAEGYFDCVTEAHRAKARAYFAKIEAKRKPASRASGPVLMTPKHREDKP